MLDVNTLCEAQINEYQYVLMRELSTKNYNKLGSFDSARKSITLLLEQLYDE